MKLWLFAPQTILHVTEKKKELRVICHSLEEFELAIHFFSVCLRQMPMVSAKVCVFVFLIVKMKATMITINANQIHQQGSAIDPMHTIVYWTQT